MSRIFSQSPVKKPRKNVFNLSHSHKLSCNMGQLIPILCEEVVPGDKFKGAANMLCRLAPLYAPMMHEVNVFTHFFFVPNRIIWNEFEDFITGGSDGTLEPVFPRFIANPTQANNAAAKKLIGTGSLSDYLGVKYGGTFSGTSSANPEALNFSQLPFRAYQKIYNEYYRDQNLEDEIDFPITSGKFPLYNGEDTSSYRLLSLRNRAWEKDYFTSALPWAQRGAPVTIPIQAGTADIVYDRTTTNRSKFVDIGGTGSAPVNTPLQNTTGLGNVGTTSNMYLQSSAGNVRDVNLDLSGTHTVDFTDGDAGILVNDFRRSIRLQEWLEKNARGGARYIEQIRSHFGVTSSDARLQRPEFLGGGKSPIMISEVLQTSETADTPQANMAGHGISAHGSHTWSKFIEEHGYIIGIMSILPRTAYQQGIDRHFLKYDKFDFYWPEFAHIGEQEIWRQELYFDASVTVTDDNPNHATFGYTPRYAEYKQRMSKVSGDFKTTLDTWHMGRIFPSPPALNPEFVISDPTLRIFNVTDPAFDHVWCLVQNAVHAVRPMPKFGVPTI